MPVTVRNLTDAAKAYCVKYLGVQAEAADEVFGAALLNGVRSGAISGADLVKLNNNETVNRDPPASKGKDPAAAFVTVTGDGTGTGSIRVKGSSEAYSNVKAVGTHPKSGQPVIVDNRPLELPSQRETALAGAFLKRMAQKGGWPVGPLSEHEMGLLEEVWDMPFTGLAGGREYAELPGRQAKAVLDDSTSGGTNLVPIFFDRNIVAAALLSGEIAPFTDIVDVTGRQIHITSVGAPSAVWGVPEGTTMQLFDTTNFIGTGTTTVFPVHSVVEVGRDLLADAAAAYDFGATLTKQLGQAIGSSLDGVVAAGDGTTQPLGIFNSAGVPVVASANGAAGPISLADAESLIFGVPKQYRQPSMGLCFIGSDVAYRRLRAIPPGTTLANARAMGTDYQTYQVLEYPFRVAQSLANNWLAFLGLKNYRLYRRAGMEIDWVTGGKTLALNNTGLLIARGRWGGRLTLANAAIIMTDAGPA